MSTLMRPECALEGTCTINPSRVARSRAPGELRLMRAPPERGKATTIPARRPRPAKSSSPRTETWRGLPLHLDVGTQLTFVMRTDVTCRLLALEVFGAGVAVLVVTGAQAVGRVGKVELPRRDVVGRVGVEQGCEVLDLPASAAELELPAAVGADRALLAVVIRVEQIAQAAEARGLDVDHARRVGQ